MSLFGHHKEAYICANCGIVDNFKRKVSGSFMGEVSILGIGLFLAVSFSWLFILLPIGYTLWRANTGKTVCADCDSPEKLPMKSPAGKLLYAKFHSESTTTEE